MLKWPLLFLSLCMMVSNACALQIRNVVDNETTTAKISSIDVTRIFVQGDRIKNVKSLKGAYTRENDEKNGEIYLQPSPLYQNSAFTILISTEQGRHFTLLLTPTASPSETLMLVPKGVGRARAARFEQASAYELTITHLVRAMKDGTLPEGYAIHEINGKKTYRFNKSVTIKLKTMYQGLNFRGAIYAITNKGRTPIQLDERWFYKAGSRALSLDAVYLAPKSAVNLYEVMSSQLLPPKGGSLQEQSAC